MKIINLVAENIKRLKAVDITPKGSVVEITGKNGNGKSSVLDAIWWALGSGHVVQRTPIRRGQESAKIRLDLGEMVITRKFRQAPDETDFTTSLTVENAEGARYSSPQKVIDAFIGALSFDPLAFTRMTVSDQFRAVAELIPEVDFDEDERLDKLARVERAKHKTESARLHMITRQMIVPDGLEPAKHDIDAINQRLSKAGEHNQQVNEHLRRKEVAKSNWDGAAAVVKKSEYDVKYLKEQLQRAQEILAANIDECGHCEIRYKELRSDYLLEDTDALLKQQKIAQEYNALLMRSAEKARLLKEASEHEIQETAFDKEIEKRKLARVTAISKAKLPVEGLGIDPVDRYVTMNGLPFDQASTAEMIRASILMAMEMNPKLRVILIKDGSMLNTESKQLVEQMAMAYDYQVWMEIVTDGEQIGFVIEDGSVNSDLVPVDEQQG